LLSDNQQSTLSGNSCSDGCIAKSGALDIGLSPRTGYEDVDVQVDVVHDAAWRRRRVEKVDAGLQVLVDSLRKMKKNELYYGARDVAVWDGSATFTPVKDMQTASCCGRTPARCHMGTLPHRHTAASGSDGKDEAAP